jgi:WD40 repeat protein
MRLVAPGPEGEPTRIRIARDRVVTHPGQERLVELLVGSRLLTSDDGNITLAHEALAREWPRLRGWLDDDIEGQRILHHLSASADAWDAMDRPYSELYRGVRLAQALEWREASPIQLAPVETAFLDESVQLRSTEEHFAQAQMRALARANRRLRVLLAAAMVLLVVATGLGFLAQRNSNHAHDAAIAREADAVGALALQTPDPPKSLLLAAAATRVSPSTSTQTDLEAALAQHPELVRTAASPGPVFGEVAVSSDGSHLVVGSLDGSVFLYDAKSLKRLYTYVPRRSEHVYGTGYPVAISPDGRTAAIGVPAPASRPVRLLSIGGDRLIPLRHQLAGWAGLSRVTSISFSADGRRVAVFADNGTVGNGGAERNPTALVWNTGQPGRPVQRMAVASANPQKVLLSADGSRLYTTDPLRVYLVRTGTQLGTDGPESGVHAALNGTASKLALLGWPSGEHENNILLVDARKFAVRKRLSGMPPGFAATVAFSPDGRQVAASDLGTAYVWDTASGQMTNTLQTNDERPKGLAFSPDGSRLYTAGSARELQEWDLSGGYSVLRTVRVSHPVAGAGNASPDGSKVAYLDPFESRITFVDVDADKTSPTKDVSLGNANIAFAWSPDSSRYALAVAAHRLDVFDPSTANVVNTVHTRGVIADMAYTPDGGSLVVAAGHMIETLDPRTLRPRHDPVRLDKPVGSVDPSPDGRHAFVTLLDRPWTWHEQPLVREAALVDLETGNVLHSGALPIEDAHFAAFSPRGRQVAVVGGFGQLLLFDPETWRPVAPTASPNGPLTMWVAYSPDGTRLLTAAGDQSGDLVTLWDTTTGQAVGIASVPGGAVSAAFRPDGTVRVVDAAGGVFSWDPSLESDIAFACQAAGRDITYDEWHAAFPDLPYRKVCTA